MSNQAATAPLESASDNYLDDEDFVLGDRESAIIISDDESTSFVSVSEYSDVPTPNIAPAPED